MTVPLTWLKRLEWDKVVDKDGELIMDEGGVVGEALVGVSGWVEDVRFMVRYLKGCLEIVEKSLEESEGAGKVEGSWWVV